MHFLALYCVTKARCLYTMLNDNAYFDCAYWYVHIDTFCYQLWNWAQGLCYAIAIVTSLIIFIFSPFTAHLIKNIDFMLVVYQNRGCVIVLHYIGCIFSITMVQWVVATEPGDWIWVPSVWTYYSFTFGPWIVLWLVYSNIRMSLYCFSFYDVIHS